MNERIKTSQTIHEMNERIKTSQTIHEMNERIKTSQTIHEMNERVDEFEQIKTIKSFTHTMNKLNIISYQRQTHRCSILRTHNHEII